MSNGHPFEFQHIKLRHHDINTLVRNLDIECVYREFLALVD